MELLKSIIDLIAKYWPNFLAGLGVTLAVSLATVVFGVILGTIFAFLRLSENKFLNFISSIYTEIFRGVPLLLQLWLFYILLSTDKVIAVTLALIVNSGAYVSEIIRSGIQAVDKGQIEAARSLGISKRVTMFKVILPQAIKNILPALGNEFVTVIKESSLASTFFIGDLMSVRNEIATSTYLALETLIIVGCIYLFLTFTISKLVGIYERVLKKNDKK